jgi:hypothetical protein
MSIMRIEFDYKELEKYATALGARIDQIPFALAIAMNRSADVTRNLLIRSTWPSAIVQRNASFIAASLTTKEARASKSSLAVEIYDKLDRGNLQMQAKGGTRTPRSGSNLAIPASTVPRGSKGVPKNLRPANLRNSFKKNGLLFTRDTKGRARLVYALKPATRIPKRVPFYEDFHASMSRELTRTIPQAVMRAMATARKT